MSLVVLSFGFAHGVIKAESLQVSALFSAGAVLQRDTPVPIWGTADPKVSVTVSFSGQEHETESDENGFWKVVLEPMPAEGLPQTLIVESDKRLVIPNIVVGEVWIASGQSNMEWRMRQIGVSPADLPNPVDPLLRTIKLDRAVSEVPTKDFVGTWESANSETLPEFSAVAYYFGSMLRKELDVPVGLINSSWGGTQIESWMTPEALSKTPFASEVDERWLRRLEEFPDAMQRYEDQYAQWIQARDAARAADRQFTQRAPRRPEGPGSRWLPGGLYNAMIYPLIPTAHSGVIWYQGETNASRHDEYAELFKAMISQWRNDFGFGDFPFYFVQLANMERRNDPSGRQWAFMREAQEAALALPLTGMALAIDIGEADDIHPRNKWDVGKRLALMALNDVYGKEQLSRGPKLDSYEIRGSDIIVSLKNAEGLRSTAPEINGFEIADEGGHFHPARAEFDGESIRVNSTDVQAPRWIRYAFQNNPDVSLVNRIGLPLAPFRTDSQPE